MNNLVYIKYMSDTAIVLQTQTLTNFDDSSFFSSLDAIDNFFGSIDNAVKKLQDDQLLNLFTLVNQLGNRAWITRAIIIEEIENRTKFMLNKEKLSKEEFIEHVAKVIDIAKSTAYEDLQILRFMRDAGTEPRLDRTFYKLALSSPDFNKAVAHAEEESDSLGGKYTTKQFARWVARERGDLPQDAPEFYTTIGFSKDEIALLLEAYKQFLKNDPQPQEGASNTLFVKLQTKYKESKRNT